VGRQWTANPLFTSSTLVAASIPFRIFLITLSLLAVASGYLFGNPAAILVKATNICLECIGIG
jgi:hypothetical protein